MLGIPAFRHSLLFEGIYARHGHVPYTAELAVGDARGRAVQPCVRSRRANVPAFAARPRTKRLTRFVSGERS